MCVSVPAPVHISTLETWMPKILSTLTAYTLRRGT